MTLARILCALLGHRPPPAPLDRVSLTLMGGRCPCARCGTGVELQAVEGVVRAVAGRRGS